MVVISTIGFSRIGPILDDDGVLGRVEVGFGGSGGLGLGIERAAGAGGGCGGLVMEPEVIGIS